MGLPSISKRLSYRRLPDAAQEGTSTIVTSSKDDYFVDIRIDLAKHREQTLALENTDDCVQWAFAGRAHTSNVKHDNAADSKQPTSWHSKWDHWIDSHNLQLQTPCTDEGDMMLRPDGTILEKGSDTDAATGQTYDYEEEWRDLDIQALGTKGCRSSLVFKVDSEGVNGLLVKVGGYCQAILVCKGQLTVERWEWRDPITLAGSDTLESSTISSKAEQQDLRSSTSNGWIRSFRTGPRLLPCKQILAHTDGKLGFKTNIGLIKEDTDDNEYPHHMPPYWRAVDAVRAHWRLVEEYYF